MKAFLDSWCILAAALVIAAAGIFEVIDQTSMIILIVVLTVCMPNRRGACGVGRSVEG
jgi:hypothetical protein